MKRWLTWWSWNGFAVLVGFALTLVSLVGGQTYLEPAIRAVTAIDQEIAAKRAKMTITRDAVALDDFAKQLGGAVFTVQPGSTDDLVAAETLHELKQRALVHRHDGVRATFAALSLAGEIDFPSVSSAYEALVQAETRNFTLENFQAANAFDADLTTRAIKDDSADRMRITALQRLRAPARAEVNLRSLIIVVTSSLGATFVLIATLKASGHAPSIPPQTSDDPRQAAIDLLTAALAETRARIAAPGSRAA